MTAEPSSRTRLYASRQASLSILVAIAAGPQRRHSAQEHRASSGPAAGIGARRGRAEGRRAKAAGDCSGEGYAGMQDPCFERGSSYECVLSACLDQGRVAPPPRTPRPGPFQPLASQAAAAPSPLIIGGRAAGAGSLYSQATNLSPVGCATPQ